MKKYFKLIFLTHFSPALMLGFSLVILITSPLFSIPKNTEAATSSRSSGYFRDFGGKTISAEANEITALRASGFNCAVPGTSVSIIPVGSPAGTPISFIIPYAVTSATGNPTRSDQWIIGKYGGYSTAYCVSPTVPPVVVTVPLQTIVYFGNSR